jgi:hypothetical protein
VFSDGVLYLDDPDSNASPRRFYQTVEGP